MVSIYPHFRRVTLQNFSEFYIVEKYPPMMWPQLMFFQLGFVKNATEITKSDKPNDQVRLRKFITSDLQIIFGRILFFVQHKNEILADFKPRNNVATETFNELKKLEKFYLLGGMVLNGPGLLRFVHKVNGPAL